MTNTMTPNEANRMKRSVNEMDWLFRQYLLAIKDLPDYECAITELTVMQLAAWAKDRLNMPPQRNDLQARGSK